MGNSSSKEARQAQRRLSKPCPSNNASSSFRLLKPANADPPDGVGKQGTVLNESMIWTSPWSGDVLPKISPELIDENCPRVQSWPSLVAAADRPSLNGQRRWSSDGKKRQQGPVRPTPRRWLSKRTQPDAYPPDEFTDPQPAHRVQDSRRMPLLSFSEAEELHGPRSRVDNMREDGIAPLVDLNPPLIRGRSLVKRTMTIWPTYRRPWSPVTREYESTRFPVSSTLRRAREPFCEPHETDWFLNTPCRSTDRATSPVALDCYSHLGGLKRGSLRIVNGSTSPARSDRMWRHQPPSSSGHGSGDHVADGSADDDTSNSLSFEKLSVSAADSTPPAAFPNKQDSAKEISLPDQLHDHVNGPRSESDRARGSAELKLQTSQIIPTADSGYGSASPVHSHPSSHVSWSSPEDSLSEAEADEPPLRNPRRTPKHEDLRATEQRQSLTSDPSATQHHRQHQRKMTESPPTPLLPYPWADGRSDCITSNDGGRIGQL
ncbi:hypothetical protein VTN31DRAFT_6829 [Thermomyces dupontii]|uniref:uncharacterized protein n=1 Tax=Talaromyces thermophilus TaxID=28565 RepID=UPI00374368B0